MVNKKVIIYLVLLLIGFLGGFFAHSLKFPTQKETMPNPYKGSPSNKPRLPDCQYAAYIPDTNGDGNQEMVTICDKEIEINFSFADQWFGLSFNTNSKIFETSESFPDLFFNSTLGSDYRLKQTVETNNKSSLGLILIIRTMECPGNWCTKGAGIYLIKGTAVKRVFQLKDSDVPGRTSGIEIISTNPLSIRTYFDFGYVGALGNRYYWSNYYDWDSGKEELVLSNTRYPTEFKKLLVEYREFEKDPCYQEGLKNETITTLYEKRKGEKKLCPNTEDDNVSPDVKDAKLFLQAKSTLQEILNGKDYSHTDVKDYNTQTF